MRKPRLHPIQYHRAQTSFPWTLLASVPHSFSHLLLKHTAVTDSELNIWLWVCAAHSTILSTFPYLSDEAHADTQTWLGCRRNRIQTQGSSSCSVEGSSKRPGGIIRRRELLPTSPHWGALCVGSHGGLAARHRTGSLGSQAETGCSVPPRNHAIQKPFTPAFSE